MVGYGNRESGATGVQDPLQARALVLESLGERWALISADLCFVGMPKVAATREVVQRTTGIPAAHVFVAATHTHSGPDDEDPDAWDELLADKLARSVADAVRDLQPARLGGGFGFLPQLAINRRWLDRPVDPAVAVIRIDDSQGRSLGAVTSFACHGVVMGSDNLLLSADWPGAACARVEAALGSGTTCVFMQGGCADANPLTSGVAAKLHEGRPIQAIGGISTYYGSPGDAAAWNIGDRRGGTFQEAAELAAAFADEFGRVWAGTTTRSVDRVWSEQIVVDAARGPDEPVPAVTRPGDALEWSAVRDSDGRLPLEVMLLGADDIVLVGEPGEIFSETSVRFRTRARLLGFGTPLLVGYANGRLDYLPEPEAFDEGGYEVIYPADLGISRFVQSRVWEATEKVLSRHRPR